MGSNRLLEMWKVVAHDLGLAISAPYIFILPSGEKVYAQILLKNFGPDKGMLIVRNYSEVERCVDELLKERYGFSVLDDPGESEQYVRRDYIELLDDWGWSGDKKEKPIWI